MTRDELIEVMDEALHTRLADDGDTKDLMRAILKAIEDAGLVVVHEDLFGDEKGPPWDMSEIVYKVAISAGKIK